MSCIRIINNLIMRFIIKAFFLFLFIFASSCKKEKVDTDCGCDGSTNRTIENLQARYTGDGSFIIADTNGDFPYVSACDINNEWEVSKDEKTWNYIISGNIKKRCPGPHPELELPAPGGPIQITFLKKI